MLEKYFPLFWFQIYFSLYNRDMHKWVLTFLLDLLVISLSLGTTMNAFSKAMALNIVPSMNNDENNICKNMNNFIKMIVLESLL